MCIALKEFMNLEKQVQNEKCLSKYAFNFGAEPELNHEMR
jgi:hypothetical protein